MLVIGIDPSILYRHAKAEPVRWTQRRRQFVNNPYFSDSSLWVNNYDDNFNVVLNDTEKAQMSELRTQIRRIVGPGLARLMESQEKTAEKH